MRRLAAALALATAFSVNAQEATPEPSAPPAPQSTQPAAPQRITLALCYAAKPDDLTAEKNEELCNNVFAAQLPNRLQDMQKLLDLSSQTNRLSPKYYTPALCQSFRKAVEMSDILERNIQDSLTAAQRLGFIPANDAQQFAAAISRSQREARETFFYARTNCIVIFGS